MKARQIRSEIFLPPLFHSSISWNYNIFATELGSCVLFLKESFWIKPKPLLLLSNYLMLCAIFKRMLLLLLQLFCRIQRRKEGRGHTTTIVNGIRETVKEYNSVHVFSFKNMKISISRSSYNSLDTMEAEFLFFFFFFVIMNSWVLLDCKWD